MRNPRERINLGVLAVHLEMAGYADVESGMDAPLKCPFVAKTCGNLPIWTVPFGWLWKKRSRWIPFDPPDIDEFRVARVS